MARPIELNLSSTVMTITGIALGDHDAGRDGFNTLPRE